jgi:uncharacterized membrane protein YfcA
MAGGQLAGGETHRATVRWLLGLGAAAGTLIGGGCSTVPVPDDPYFFVHGFALCLALAAMVLALRARWESLRAWEAARAAAREQITFALREAARRDVQQQQQQQQQLREKEKGEGR